MNDHSNQHYNNYKTAPPLPGTEHDGMKQRVPKPSKDVLAKHEESVRKYPELSLSKNEYVITVIRRHPIGLVFIWTFVALLAAIVFAILGWYGANTGLVQNLLLMSVAPPPVATIFPLALIFLAFIALGGVVASIIYVDNRFYLTNESVFQFLRTGILQHKMQVINLINVEDASHEQNGLLQNLFNYGTLRLSTQGQETVYHFYFVSNPRKLVGVVNEAAEKAVRKLEGFPAGEY